VPKAGWVRFRWTRAVPEARSFRVKLDRAGRWHVAFAAIPPSIEGPGTGEVVGVDRGVAISAALSTGEMLTCPRLSVGRRRQLKRLQRKLVRAEPGRGVRAKAGLNREILASGWGTLVKRLEQKAPGRVKKINSAYTSQRCSACRHVSGADRKSQAVFTCTACGYIANADVNAAINIAAGHAVTARGGVRATGPVNREPQPALLSP
jgi:putative transposase